MSSVFQTKLKLKQGLFTKQAIENAVISIRRAPHEHECIYHTCTAAVYQERFEELSQMLLNPIAGHSPLDLYVIVGYAPLTVDQLAGITHVYGEASIKKDAAIRGYLLPVTNLGKIYTSINFYLNKEEAMGKAVLVELNYRRASSMHPCARVVTAHRFLDQVAMSYRILAETHRNIARQIDLMEGLCYGSALEWIEA